jgi:cystathionine beta-lyase
MRKETRLLHYGRPRLPGPANPPVERASTILHDSIESYEETKARRETDDNVLSYGRRGTGTAHALMRAVNDLEGGDGCWLFPTGVAAIATTLQAFLRSGDHLLITETAFHATNTVCKRFLHPNGIETDTIPWDTTDLGPYLKPGTRAVFVESPGSNTLEIMDLPAICQSAKAHDLTVIADNTYGSGWLYRPLALGCDVSIIAGTKYLSGHADVMMGAAAARGPAAHVLRDAVLAAGQTLAPDEAYATLRGMRTLHLRLERHQESALRVVSWFQGQDCVAGVLHPALPDHPGHATWARDAEGTNGLLSVVFHDDFPVETFLDSLALFVVGSSWGGFESLFKTFELPDRLRAHYGREMGTAVRFHVGLEHIDDLLEDLEQAHSKVG